MCRLIMVQLLAFFVFRLLGVHDIVLGEVLKNEPYCSHIWSKIHNNEALVTRVTELGTTTQVLQIYSYIMLVDCYLLGVQYFL